ncbi:hypothetical protein DH2020_017296 [Rehmannia glutinosa]|uniref:Reverse transcriptase Ty1/copia-type domain-containing protein n=1 Tax=Rehmannia glutinosa TaxID=99300 RepID=A0ABR0WS41_REHGL
MLALVAQFNWELKKMDVKTAFLHGELEEKIYMRQPEGFVVIRKTDHVCLLKKSLYGLKQSPRQWNKKFDECMLSLKFKRSSYDHCLYFKENAYVPVFLLIYVDDMLLISSCIKSIEYVKNYLSAKFDMKYLGDANRILGMNIVRDSENSIVFLNQISYVEKILSKFSMSTAKPVNVPLAAHFVLSKEQSPKTEHDLSCMKNVPYSNAIGSVILNILHAVCLSACFQSNPKESHMSIVKRIFRYLKDTIQYGLFYPKNEKFSLQGYSDSDYAGNIDDRKSTSGSCQFLGDFLVSWFSKKQNCVSLSTAEVEYIFAVFCCIQLLWIKQTLANYKCSFENVPIFCDNMSAINIAQNPAHHNRTKHIEIRHHFLRDCVSKRKTEIYFVPSQDQLTDIFTKPLSAKSFASIRARLGIMHTE